MVDSPRFRGWRALIVFSSFFILLGLCAPEVVSVDTQDDAYGLIQLADESVRSAFEAVSEAESLGANVSKLIEELNEAVSLLTKAKVLFSNGDFAEAIEVAAPSVEMVEDVRDEALSLYDSALSHREFVFRVSLIASSIAVPVFLFLMFSLWRWFKRFYIRRILELRPEVASNA